MVAFKKFASLLAVTLVFAIFFTSCSTVKKKSVNQKKEDIVASTRPFKGEIPTTALSGDVQGIGYDTRIRLNESRIAISGRGASSKGNKLTIFKPGEYLISGKLENGQIIVDLESNGAVRIYLNGVHVVSKDSSAVLIKNSKDETVFSTIKNSINILQDSPKYLEVEEGEISPNACVYSEDDLKFSGNGTLYINANFQKGISSKNNVQINSGSIYINSVDDGIRAKDNLKISNGFINIRSLADGLRTSNTEKESKGNINISNGEIIIQAANDAVQAANALNVSGGSFYINSLKGKANDSQLNKETSVNSSDEQNLASANGLKSGADLIINGGEFFIDVFDDGIRSYKNALINAGEFNIKSNQDGILVDLDLSITGGWITIEKSVEGIEATNVLISGGKHLINSSDDGVNASVVNEEKDEKVKPRITFSGGETFVYSKGDGIDSNGDIKIDGGKLVVYTLANESYCAIDLPKKSKLILSGGEVLALSNSTEIFKVKNSTQGYLLTDYYLNKDSVNSFSQGSNELISFVCNQSFTQVFYTNEKIKKAQQVNLLVGGINEKRKENNLFELGGFSKSKTTQEIKLMSK